MKRMIHWLRRQVYGECPSCGSTRLKDVQGWRKSECRDCGDMFNWASF